MTAAAAVPGSGGAANVARAVPAPDGQAILPGAGRTALFLSPHLDDAAFSAGATMAQFADQGLRVVMATVFTRSVPDPQGFALACQLDKGLPASVDYMALRRDEDREAARILGAEVRWLDLPEAPHRGYGTAAALFADPLPGDGIVERLAPVVAALLDELRPGLVFTCQGLGGHVDHRQLIRAVLQVFPAEQMLFWRDTPYVIRNPETRPDPALPAAVIESLQAVDATPGLDRKLAASCAYASQVGFQFGGPDACAAALRQLAEREGGERFAGLPALGLH